MAGRGRRPHREFVEIGLAEQHRAGGPQFFGDGRFVGRGEAVEDVGAGGGQHSFGAEQILDRDRDALERPRLAFRQPRVRGRRHFQRAIRGLGDKGVERLYPLDRVVVGGGQLARREFLRRQPVARLSQSEVGELAHSTTLGTAKKPRAARGALPSTASRLLPSVTTSSRIGSVISATLVIGGTFSVSTAISCSTQSRMPLSSAASGSSSSSPTRMRARVAMRATVALSNAMISKSFAAKAGVKVPWLTLSSAMIVG